MRIDATEYGNEAALHALVGALALVEVRDNTGKLVAYDADVDVDLEGYGSALTRVAMEPLTAAAAAACDEVTAQIIPDAAHQLAYTNAATIVWASGGKAPSTDPVKGIFAAQGASVGITDPEVFAQVVTVVSLSSMELATMLGVFRGAVAKASAPADLAAALAVFESSLSALVTSLNGAGLTIQIAPPAPIVFSGVNG